MKGEGVNIVHEMYNNRVVNRRKEGSPVATKKKAGGKSGVKNQFGPTGGRIISK